MTCGTSFCAAQGRLVDPRWTLRDGMITAPEAEVRKAAAYRLVADTLIEVGSWALHEKGKEILELHGALVLKDTTIARMGRNNLLCLNNYNRVTGERDGYAQRVDKLQPWATVGKVTVVVAVSAVVFFGTVEVIRIVSP